MMPMADNFNHSNVVDALHVVSNGPMHLEPDRESTYFTKEKYMNNYELIFEEDDKAKVSGRFNREQFEKNQDRISMDRVRKRIDERKVPFWEVEYIRDTFDEDNDSEDENEESKCVFRKFKGEIKALIR